MNLLTGALINLNLIWGRSIKEEKRFDSENFARFVFLKQQEDLFLRLTF